MEDRCCKSVDEVDSCCESICPIHLRNVGVREKCKSCFYDMSVASLGNSIMLWSVWRSGHMRDAIGG